MAIGVVEEEEGQGFRRPPLPQLLPAPQATPHIFGGRLMQAAAVARPIHPQLQLVVCFVDRGADRLYIAQLRRPDEQALRFAAGKAAARFTQPGLTVRDPGRFR